MRYFSPFFAIHWLIKGENGAFQGVFYTEEITRTESEVGASRVAGFDAGEASFGSTNYRRLSPRKRNLVIESLKSL
jgi:hypothetical protein